VKRLTILLLICTQLVVSAQPSVVLPQRFKDAPVLIENSPQLKALQKRINQDNKNWQQYSDVVETRLRDQERLLAKLQEENARFKATNKPWYSKIPFFSILSLGLSFVSNPFSFVITRLIELGLGLVAVAVFVALVRFLWRRRKGLNWKLQLPKS
jgi:hypothetical protein